MFTRTLTNVILESAKTFYAVSLVGPRQSGKTTLLKFLFPHYLYLNLEDPDTLARVKADPRGVFDHADKKWIIDEAQQYPALFSYLLGFIDHYQVKGQFILSGSQNFALLEKISESLAGRVAALELLPLTYQELISEERYKKISLWDMLYQGSYPGPYQHQINTSLWYKSYVTTYLQRDVRQLLNIKDLSQFHLFLKLCAARHAQLVNFSEIGSACGVSHTTIQHWIHLLELSYILFKLPPYYKNFNKQLVKTPKLYFYDAGLVCHLLGIESAEHAKIHASRGALFEGYVISEIQKHWIAQGKSPHLYFWHHHRGFEIDLLIEKNTSLTAVEIKSSATFSTDFIKQLVKFEKLDASLQHVPTYVVYAGGDSFTLQGRQVISYVDLEALTL